MKQPLSLFFVLLLSVTGSVHAFNGYYAPAPAPIENPVQTIQNALHKLQAFGAGDKQGDAGLMRGFIEKEIIPHFAFDQMTYWIAGPFARQMNAQNMQELENRVKQNFFNSLSTHLGSYDANTTKVNFRPAHYRGPDEAVVSALIYSANQPPAKLDFRMKSQPGNQGSHWKIVDISANGISATLYYRQHFISTLRQY
ncbi:MAG: ABC transporter substrate-binding protein [Gammaproteobacteria bacterium]|nr:ABC transporter substrate-binding protein [Gammaproteobacteria bacterium]